MTFYELYQYYKNKGAETGEGIESISNKQVIVPQQYQQGGGDGPQGDFGKFGNLLKDTEKTFTKDVYTIDKNMYPGAEMTGSFKPTEVTGYKNATSGIYQTIDGKNINHAGLNIKPAFAYALEALGFGEPKNLTNLPYKEGYIAGTFTGKNWKDVISNIGNPFKNKSTIDYSTIADTSVDANENSYVDTSNNNGGGGGNTGSGNFSNIDNSGKNYGPYSNNNNNDYSNKGGGADSGGSSSPTNVGNPFGYAEGGRINFELGGDTNYRVMVTKMFIESGAEEGTGMGIEEFANTYFPLPQMANGGIINTYGY